MVAVAVDKVAFLLRVRAPQQEHHAFAVLIQGGDHLIGKGFPAQVGVRVRAAAFHRQHGVEQQHPLFSPALQVAVIRAFEAGNVGRQLFIHVHQRRRRRHAGAHREREAVRLIGPVIRILAEDDDLDVRQLGIAESVEHVLLRWINGLTGLTFSGNKGERFNKIGLLFLFADHVMPGEGGGHKRSPLFSLAIHGL